jgi:exodeoxyribonuclease VII small subunit
LDSHLTFEAAMARLEQVVRQLEAGEIPLDQALALFQEGVTLVRQCTGQLDDAEARIEKLLTQPDGSVTTQPLDGTREA